MGAHRSRPDVLHQANTNANNIMDIEGIFAITFFFGSVFGMFYIYFFTRHKERMNLIDKGQTVEAFRKQSDPLRTLKIGMILLGAGLGLVFGHLLETHTSMGAELPYFIMVAICGGAAMILFYILFGRKQQG